MQSNLSTAERVARGILAFVFGCIGFVIFPPAGIGAIFLLCATWSLFEAVTGWCPLHRRIGEGRESILLMALLGIQLSLAYGWAMPGYEKITGNFADGLAKTLQFFASKNPYAWYVQFLDAFILPHATLFGVLIEWSELLIGIALAVSCAPLLLGNSFLRRAACAISMIALVGGLLMNANFWFAAGWTSAGTAGSNTAMFWPELALLYAWGMLLFSDSLLREHRE